MKFLAVLFASLAMILSTHGQTTSFQIATYNIRYDAKADLESGNPWKIRKHEVAKLIERHQFDIVGVQEPNAQQLTELQSLLPSFHSLGHPYGGKDGNAHHCATFFKKELFEDIDSGVFWFSETPNEPSIGWDATDRRICHWIKLRDKETKSIFFVFNAHFYWKHESARKNSGPLLISKIKEIAGDAPSIALGDFNSTPDTPQVASIKEHLSDAFEITQAPRQGVENTGFPGGVFEGDPNARIDYLFFSKHWEVKNYRVLSDKYDDKRYPSDHLPVVSFVSLKAGK